MQNPTIAVIASILQIAVFIGYADSTFAAQPPIQAREITKRGSLFPDELNNISVFRNSSLSVVHITTLDIATNFFTMDVMQVPLGTGTGFVWDDDGHIVTNFHVIKDGSAARVTLSDQSNWKASLVGVYPDRDLAVLKIDTPKEKLRPIALGESNSLQVGQKVFAIGNPFGLDQTLTTGIVSALNRDIKSVTQRTIHGVIQTDAAINPGNSGGPLLDSAGRLIGVNTAIYSPTGAYAGIGFAIPVNEVVRIVPRLIRDGRIVRPTLGIQGASDDVRQMLKLPPGVVIVGIEERGAADKIGIVPYYRRADGLIVAGDELIGLDKMAVKDMEDMLDILEKYHPGESISITLLRNGRKITKRIILGPLN